MFKLIAILAGILFWPINLFISNTPQDFFNYLTPALLIIISLLIFKTKKEFYLLPLLAIPIIQPKLALLPIVACVVDILSQRPDRRNISILLISLILALVSYRGFSGQTVFKIDYEAQQSLIRKIYLYPNPLVARIYQNKARIITDQLSSNFLALVDPNNYFFGFHPREITVENQNLKKFPSLALVFLFFGLFNFSKLKDKHFLFVLGISSLLSLAILNSFDRTDFILWVPISILLVSGFNMFLKTKIGPFIFVPYFLFSIHELLRIFVK